MMSTKIKATFASLGLAAMLLPAVAGAAGDQKKFSRADFERCNQQAMQIAGVESDSPAALPGAAQPGSQPATQPGAGTGTSGTGTTGSSTMSGSGSGTTGSGSTGTGTMSGSGSVGAGTEQQLEQIVQAYRDCLQQQQRN